VGARLAPAGVRGDHFVLVGCGGVWVGTWRCDVRSDELGSTPTTGTVESDDDPEVPPRPCCPSGVGVAPAAGGVCAPGRSHKNIHKEDPNDKKSGRIRDIVISRRAG